MKTYRTAVVKALVVCVTLWALPAAAAETDWSTHDWSQEEIRLGTPRMTAAEAMESARLAVANSPMRISMNTVGFDIPAGSQAEVYLQSVAEVGGGSYFRAEQGGELIAAMGAATRGRGAMAPPAPADVIEIQSYPSGRLLYRYQDDVLFAAPSGVRLFQWDGEDINQLPTGRRVFAFDGEDFTRLPDGRRLYSWDGEFIIEHPARVRAFRYDGQYLLKHPSGERVWESNAPLPPAIIIGLAAGLL